MQDMKTIRRLEDVQHRNVIKHSSGPAPVPLERRSYGCQFVCFRSTMVAFPSCGTGLKPRTRAQLLVLLIEFNASHVYKGVIVEACAKGQRCGSSIHWGLNGLLELLQKVKLHWWIVLNQSATFFGRKSLGYLIFAINGSLIIPMLY